MTEYQDAMAALARIASRDEDIAEFLFKSLHFSYVSGENAAVFMHKFAQQARREGAKTNKGFGEGDFEITMVFGDVEFMIFSNRKTVCEARVVGQETVEVPDYSAVPKKTITRDVVEWDCHPLLKSLDD